MNRPTICCAIIARNEERDLPKCIASLRGVADDIVIVDTGSTDRTGAVALAKADELGISLSIDTS